MGSLCGKILTPVGQRNKMRHQYVCSPTSSLVLSASMVTGAAPPVSVATLHRCGAENGSDKKTLQARV